VKKGFIKTVKGLLGKKPKKPVRKYFSKETKKAVLKLQRYQCAANRCHNKKFLEFDHIRYRSDNSISNCQALCPYHHRQKTRIDKRKSDLDKRAKRGKQKSKSKKKN